MLMARDVEIPVSVLHDCFVTVGDALYWRERPVSHFQRQSDALRFNSRWAGQPAFSSTNGRGYPTTTLTFRGRKYRLQAHRVVFAMAHDKWPEGLLDHRNGDTFDRSIGNLRDTDAFGNCKNSRRSRRNTSGVTGVRWFKPRSLWVASIGHNRKVVSLGYFREFDDAVRARKKAEAEFGYSPRHGSAQTSLGM